MPDKEKKVKQSDDPLMECQSFDAAEKLLDAAQSQSDKWILRQIQGGPDCIAAEVMYHHSCYRNFTRPTKAAADKTTSPYHQAFATLAEEMEADLFGPRDIRALEMENLNRQYVKHLEVQGIQSNYHVGMLKRRIANHFGDRVKFVRSSVTEGESVISATLHESSLLGVLGQAATAAKKWNPATYNAVSDGDFCVAKSEQSLAQVAVDTAIEQTFNRDSKMPGGVIVPTSGEKTQVPPPPPRE